jgi:hypothetical protein
VKAKIAATAVAICSYIVMGGFFAQNGVILDAAAGFFHAPVTTTATLFSYLTGGNLIGLIVFFAATFAFGFSSTCLFKLMISVGSEQIPHAPPQLVTLLLLSASVGGTLAPAVSARIVAAHGAHAGIVMAACCYALTLGCALAALAALAVERMSRRSAALPQVAA